MGIRDNLRYSGLSDREKQIFRLGRLEGERRLQYRLNLLMRTNHRLWQELTELDAVEPIAGGAQLSMAELKTVLKAIRGQRWKQHAVRLLNAKILEAKEKLKACIEDIL